MNTPHTDADLLRAVADGKQMQRKEWDEWVDCTHETALVRISMGMPTRVKPEPKPDVVRYIAYVPCTGFGSLEEVKRSWREFSVYIKATTNGETGKVTVEVVS